MKKKIIAGASAVVVVASTFGIAQIFAGGNEDETALNNGETKETKDAPKVENVDSAKEKSKSEQDDFKEVQVADLAELEGERYTNDQGEEMLKVKGTPPINVEEYKDSLKNTDEKVSDFIAEQSESFSEQMDYSKWKQTGYDEGFNYYLKAQEFTEAKDNTNFHMGKLNKTIQKDFVNIGHMKTLINHMQFARTSHLGHQGQAKEDVERSDQWKEAPEEMRQAYEYIKQIIHDLDVALNHDGEGETYGVTYTLNGDKASKVESFFNNPNQYECDGNFPVAIYLPNRKTRYLLHCQRHRSSI
ncbi:hypothetical protein [Lentibacillus sp. CBA3610]|uniref:hypothetical protein n=1 Tax=Lentibacillus sp. CBA3610 TaxID=2518176 RepID=UPI0015959C24|nr:hypothetical protein [Lentibacillus sp. CBA3610]QKY70064.1 hypothetical protein Len3610_11115 [Lentibacillus sp. CBA3610]